MSYYKGEKVKTFIINSQKNAITHSPDNLLQTYINFEGRGTELPLSYSTFEKTLLTTFINSKTILSTNIDYKADEGENPRQLECSQMVQLCNIIAEEMLIGKYDAEIGTYRVEKKIATGAGDSIPDDHLAACRLFREDVMYNWVQYIYFLLDHQFSFRGTKYDKANLFQQKLTDVMWNQIRLFVKRLHELPLWRDRSMSSTIFGGKQNYAYWEKIFGDGTAPDGTRVLAQPLNFVEMISE